MCWWPSSANVLPWREVFTKFYRFSASRFSRKCPFYRRSKHSTPNRTYSITLTSSFFSTSNRTGMIRDFEDGHSHVSANTDLDLAAFLPVLNGIVDQVHNDLLQARAIALDINPSCHMAA